MDILKYFQRTVVSSAIDLHFRAASALISSFYNTFTEKNNGSAVRTVTVAIRLWRFHAFTHSRFEQYS